MIAASFFLSSILRLEEELTGTSFRGASNLHSHAIRHTCDCSSSHSTLDTRQANTRHRMWPALEMGVGCRP